MVLPLLSVGFDPVLLSGSSNSGENNPAQKQRFAGLRVRQLLEEFQWRR